MNPAMHRDEKNTMKNLLYLLRVVKMLDIIPTVDSWNTLAAYDLSDALSEMALLNVLSKSVLFDAELEFVWYIFTVIYIKTLVIDKWKKRFIEKYK